MNECLFHDVPDNRREFLLFDMVERMYRGKNRILVFTSSRERAIEIDRMLWILRQESFIPHRIFEPDEWIEDAESDVPVGIVTTEENPIRAAILIADGHCGIDFACGFDTTHEFVDHLSAERTESCRRRFRGYKDRQIPVRHIKDTI